eukprot:4353539-Pyramimonas_sp.AAC.1
MARKTYHGTYREPAASNGVHDHVPGHEEVSNDRLDADRSGLTANGGCGVCAQGVSRLTSLSAGATGSVLVFWSQDSESSYEYILIEGGQSVNVEVLLGDRGDSKKIFMVQFCLYEDHVVRQAVREEPGVPRLGG